MFVDLNKTNPCDKIQAFRVIHSRHRDRYLHLKIIKMVSMRKRPQALDKKITLMIQDSAKNRFFYCKHCFRELKAFFYYKRLENTLLKYAVIKKITLKLSFLFSHHNHNWTKMGRYLSLNWTEFSESLENLNLQILQKVYSFLMTH